MAGSEVFEGLPSFDYMDSLDRFRRSSDYTDLKIICQHREWNVHRVVFCASSGYFDTMCRSMFKEAIEGCVDLSDDEPDVVDIFITAMYRYDYDEGKSSEKEIITRLLLHSKVYLLADKYSAAPIKNLCLRKAKALVKDWEPSEQTISMQQLEEAARMVWASTPDSDTALRWVYLRMMETIWEFDLLGLDAFLNFVRDGGELAVDVCRLLVNLKSREHHTSPTAKVDKDICKDCGARRVSKVRLCRCR